MTTTTHRGFKMYAEFPHRDYSDSPERILTVQESSLATESKVWIGLDDNRAHLSVEEARRVAEALQEFAGRPTGFLDSEGRPIYEGDILRVSTSDFAHDLHGTWADYQVTFRNGLWVGHYLQSEKGQILPNGYLACELSDYVDSDALSDKERFFAQHDRYRTLVGAVLVIENPEGSFESLANSWLTRGRPASGSDDENKIRED